MIRMRLSAETHRRSLLLFAAVVLGHWAEHLVQAVQIWGLGWPSTKALGLLGLVAPGLVRSEWLHWVYNGAVLLGLVLLAPGIRSLGGRWWRAALWVQVWHFTEHALLLVQVLVGANLLGREVPTSIVQLVAPRVELHLFYNAVVTLLFSVALVRHVNVGLSPEDGRSVTGRTS